MQSVSTRGHLSQGNRSNQQQRVEGFPDARSSMAVEIRGIKKKASWRKVSLARYRLARTSWPLTTREPCDEQLFFTLVPANTELYKFDGVCMYIIYKGGH